ncbi:hypothetical protein ElyMa_003215300 [Elysia marginata]|uniref:Uncharacterized protein n=1 Tax=Elysia marginata TaxID=1093978 RepID=A0AAV4J109_9GAST|nr:hypothetical protein ElyMa_003215300 [Elysia marginata]
MFQKKAISSVVYDGHADVTIVQTAVSYPETNPTIVIGEDTYLLVLLCFHVCLASRKIYLRSDIQFNKITCMGHQTGTGSWATDMQVYVVCHAISDCDTTSSMFGIGEKRFYC